MRTGQAAANRLATCWFLRAFSSKLSQYQNAFLVRHILPVFKANIILTGSCKSPG